MFKLNEKGMARLANFLENNLCHYQTFRQSDVERWAAVAESASDAPYLEIRHWMQVVGRTAYIQFHADEYDVLYSDEINEL